MFAMSTASKTRVRSQRKAYMNTIYPKRTLYLYLPDIALSRENRYENLVVSPDSIQLFQLVAEDIARSYVQIDQILWPMYG
jgi:hypothetical protein